MKEIIKLMPQDNKFKLKLVGYQLLILLIMIIGMIIPMLLASSYSYAVAFIGVILLYAVIALLIGVGLYFYVNKLLPKYYEHFELSLGQSVKKGIAGVLIGILVTLAYIVAFAIISVIGGLIAALGSIFGFIGGLLIIVGIVVATVQMAGFGLGIFYAILENVDRKKMGFRAVFKTYFKSILVIRKDCVKISIALIIPVVLLYLASIIITLIITLATIMISLMLYIVASIILIIGFTFLMVWLVTTEYVYIFKKYGEIALKM